MTRALLIFGPTATGKSALALELAERLGGEIVNADSMQVYRDLRVLTARPGAADEARAPHHLYGHIDGSERYSVGRWLGEAHATIEAIGARGAVPIVVGGTGLYFTALTRGLADIPPVDPAVADALQDRLRAEGAGALHDALARVDPIAAARIRPSDPQRILRALGVFETTGAALSALQAGTAPGLAAWRGWVLAADRTQLRQRIGARFDSMSAQGALEEVRTLAARSLPAQAPVMRALGVRELLGHLQGALTLAEAKRRAIVATAQLAKRQETWARGQFASWPRLAQGQIEPILAEWSR